MFRKIAFAYICALALSAWCFALDYQTSWIGNTFGGENGVFVQMDSRTLFTAPDGTCFLNVGWEEGGEQAGIYKDGRVLSNPGYTHGWGNEGGVAVVANDKYIFIAQGRNNEGGGLKDHQTWPEKGKRWDGLTRRTRESLGKLPAPFEGGKGGSGYTAKDNFLIINESPDGTHAGIKGLALDDQNRLYVSNPVKSEILVYDAESMKKLKSWPFENAGHIATAPDGSLWVIQGIVNNGRLPADAPAPKIVHLSATGEKLPGEITDVPVPTGMAFDPQGRMLVSDNGPDQQVKIYDITADQPKMVDTFGRKGGIYAGVRGKVAPLKFHGLQGVGCDRDGNIYVCCNGWGGNGSGLFLESYKPDGTRNWVLYGLEFVDNGDFDRSADGEHIYTNYEHFTMDYDKPLGDHWSYVGYTLDRFRFPNDPRLFAGYDSSLIRNVNGHKLMFTLDMYSSHMAVYRFEADSEIAVPCGFFWKGTNREVRNFPEVLRPFVKNRFIWIDKNGDGQITADEVETDGKPEPAIWAWWVDSNGDVWQGYQYTHQIARFPLESFTDAGVPVYSRATAEVENAPAPFAKTGHGSSLERVQYYPEEDAMYLSGYTTELPNPHGWWKVYGRLIVRYENWTGRNGTRRLAWQNHPATVVGYNGKKERMPASFDVAGDYLFSIDSRSAVVTIYDKATGAPLDTMAPGPEVGGQIGWIDVPYGMFAYQRNDGEYLVIAEDDYRAKNVIFRFRKPANPAPAAPADLQAVRGEEDVTIKWQAVPNAKSYVIERSAADGTYEQLGYATDPAFNDNTAHHVAGFKYRITAVGWGGVSEPSEPAEVQ